MIRLYLLLMILQSAFILKAQDSSFSYHPLYSTVLDSERGKELLHQCSRPTTPKKISSYTSIAQDDIDKLEANFKRIYSIKSFNGITLQSLDTCLFQYTGIVMNKKRYIYINAVRIFSVGEIERSYMEWKTKPIIVCDGGENYWGVLFSIDEQRFINIAFNGIA